MNLKLENKRALVSGSSGGIGHAIATTLGREGAQTIINGRSEESVKKAIAEAQKNAPQANFLPLVADLGTPEGAKSAMETYPEVDILVNNLGIYWFSEFTEISDEDWSRIFEVNVMSGVRLARHYMPKMLDLNWGRIIFVASEAGILIPEKMIHYGVSKAAQLAMASGLAQITKGTGVTVNSVLPGPSQTDSVMALVKKIVEDSDKKDDETMGREFISAHRSNSLLGRLIKPEEIASLVAYVASPLSAATNGAALRADGGLVQSIV